MHQYESYYDSYLPIVTIILLYMYYKILHKTYSVIKKKNNGFNFVHNV